MVRHLSLRAALVAATATVAGTLATAGPAHADDPDLDKSRSAASAAGARKLEPSRRAARRADETTPLAVTLDTLSPSSIPARGNVRLAGTVTNNDTVPWLAVNVYAFISQEPMTTRAQLAAAVQVDEGQSVGERITEIGSFDTIDQVAPGQSQQFSFTVDVDLLEADSPGVYWFGAHALGERGDEGRDPLAVADGRARTFLPMVPNRREGREAVSVVVPLRKDITYAEDGSLGDLDEWVTTLDVGGRLRSLVELAATAGDQTVCWLVDPALVDAVRQLASGNPARSLTANLDEGEPEPEPSEDGTASGSPSGEPTPSDDPSAEPGDGDATEDPSTADLPDDLDPEARAAADVARAWLDRLRAAMDADDEILVLPYGDTDVSAAARHDDSAYTRARERSAGQLPGIDLPTIPAVAPPSGYLSPEAVETLTEDERILVGDKLFADAPAVADVGGRRLVVTSSGAAGGGPVPGDPRATVAMRQRILAEAAVRFLKPGRAPLVVLLPYDWVPTSSSTFFSGLDLGWLDLTTVARATDAVAAEYVAADDLQYPTRQTEFELDAANFDAADLLADAGARLEAMLTLNNLVGGTVRDQALTSTSYGARARPDSTRAATDRSRGWIQDRLAQVEVNAPQAVTLSSINGSFPTTIRNRLDEPVTVSLAAEEDATDGDLAIIAPPEIEIAAKGRATILLDARTETPGVHDVTLVVTDREGRVLGGSDDLSIRSARVSNIIWLFLATGVGLLFGTIGFRLFRRVRAARQ
jgi:hypothetical protein